MIVLGNQTHEVRNLPDDDAVGAGQTAGRSQVAAGIAGFQRRSRRRCTGADCAGAPQVCRVDVYQAGRARCVKTQLKLTNSLEARLCLFQYW